MISSKSFSFDWPIESIDEINLWDKLKKLKKKNVDTWDDDDAGEIIGGDEPIWCWGEICFPPEETEFANAMPMAWCAWWAAAANRKG